MSTISNSPNIGTLSHNSYKFKEVKWKISKDYILLNNVDCYIQSPLFSFAHATWTMCLAPNGNTNLDSAGWIHLGIQKLDSNIPEHLVTYKFYFETKKRKEFNAYQQSYVFRSNYEISSMLYMKKHNFLAQYKSLTKENVLTIVCQMRTPKINVIEEFSQTELAEPFAKLSLKKCKQKPESFASNCKGSNISCCLVTFSGIKILSDLKELFLKQEECDVILNVKGEEFPAHRVILVARSSVFASTFRNDMKEKATCVIDIEDCDMSSFSDFLCYLYCGSAENLSTENVFSLFTTADKYDVQDLRSECIEFMKKNLSVGTFCDTIALALKHSEKELIELTTYFFAKNLREIIVTVKWLSFLFENPVQSNELLIKALVPYKKQVLKN